MPAIIAILIVAIWSITRLRANKRSGSMDRRTRAHQRHLERIQRDSLRSPYNSWEE